MKIKARKFDAIYSATFNDWEIETEEFIIKVKELRIKDDGFGSPKSEHQRIKAIDVEFELKNSWIILLSWKDIKREHYWNIGDPDKPRNLAKTVTVK